MEEEKKDIKLEEDTEPEKKYSVPWKSFLIVLSVIITLMVVCVVVILLNGGFYQW